MTSTDHPYVFAAKIQKIWIMRCIDVPKDISKAIAKEAGELKSSAREEVELNSGAGKGAAANTKHIPIHGWIEGLPFQNTLVPRGGGNYRFHIHSRIWRKLQIDAGAAVEVTMLLDTEPREAAVPPDLAAELANTPRALAAFNSITPALRRQIVNWVDAAKQSRTRDKRIRLTVSRMQARAAKNKKRGTKKSGKKGKLKPQV
jgi:hypothetical protein